MNGSSVQRTFCLIVIIGAGSGLQQRLNDFGLLMF